jgi:hypothetical protein
LSVGFGLGGLLGGGSSSNPISSGAVAPASKCSHPCHVKHSSTRLCCACAVSLPGASADEVAGVSGTDVTTVVFPFGAFESQLRLVRHTMLYLSNSSLNSLLSLQLADLCYMIGDYETAANSYRRLRLAHSLQQLLLICTLSPIFRCRDEARPEKTPSYFAAAAEMAGLAGFFSAVRPLYSMI